MDSVKRALPLIISLLALILLVPAQAITPQEEHDMLADKISEMQGRLEQASTRLKCTPKEEWSQLDIQEYLHAAMWTVHYGIVQYTCDKLEVPTSVISLGGTEYIPAWPENPFKDFSPMKVLSVNDGFQSGELVAQVCPVEYYSGIKHPRPRSFDIAVYGPTVEFAQFGNAEVTPGNEAWAIVPPGTLYMTGMFTESGEHLKKKVEKMKAAQASKK